MKFNKFLKEKWWIFALIVIFIFAYYIRSFNIIEDRILSFDPTFQYRFTKYFADWGFFPEWDEMTYYVGRPINSSLLGPFMMYITTFLWWILKPFGFSLLTTAAYSSAIYGAAITIPAFLLGRELSNEYGGLMSAFLVGTAPQILIRTFGSSYDTDQLAIFFILLTVYLGYYMLRKKDVKSFTLAFVGFLAFSLTWENFIYSYMILGAAIVVTLLMATFIAKNPIKRRKAEIEKDVSQKFSEAFREFKTNIYLTFGLLLALFGAGWFVRSNPWNSFSRIFGFAFSAESWIVNISIAELQKFNVFSLDGWILSTGRFTLGLNYIDTSFLIIMLGLMVFGLYASYKKDYRRTALMLTIFTLGLYTSFSGMRFTQFTASMFLILVGVGFGYFYDYLKNENFLKIFAIGLALSILFIAGGISMSLGKNLGPDINANWDNAWEFLKTETPELSIVGTWWDPGHMIGALAERRSFADGAHCGHMCMLNINDRITDLGKIMSTSNENEALQLIKKYQGNSPNVYWIASDDLIGKFRWLQYFGTGCDGTTDQSCPLYAQLPRSDIKYNDDGYPVAVEFYDVTVMLGNVPVPVIIQGKNGVVVQEVVFYNQNGTVGSVDLSSPETIETMKQFETYLDVTIADSVAPMTIWIPSDYSSVTVIPPSLRNAILTKMFFFEGQGLEHFKQVYRNNQVKIYEVI